ncbi:MAG: translation initiation factor IF-2 [bacterium]
MRVYELAKSLGISSKDLLAYLSGSGVEVSSHMSVLSADAIKKIRAHYGKKKEEPKKDIAASKEKEKSMIQKHKAVKEEVKPLFHEEDEEAIKARKDIKTTPKVYVKVETESTRGKAEGEKRDSQKFVSKKKPVKRFYQEFASQPQKNEPVKEITIQESMPLFEVAELMRKSTGDLILTLLKEGKVCNRNHVLAPDVIQKLANQFGITVVKPQAPSQDQIKETEGKALFTKGEASRWPIIVVMGHVDHGKTTLLDYIRKMNVALKEKGGITQHISAYEVASKHGKIIFLDTPGHEAFSYLRQRGARITDIVVLVVAADDGVKPQTIEAIKHAKAAEVPIIVAINKVDKVQPSAIETVRRQLSQHDLMPEDWGGQTICVPISAKTGQGVEELLEMIVLQSQMMELSGSKQGPARAFVLESQLEKGYGPVASIICTQGTLKVGDYFVCGNSTGKVRLLVDTYGQKVQEVGPSVPVQVVGFNSFPASGDWFTVVPAKEYTRIRSGKETTHYGAPLFAQQQAISVVGKTDQKMLNLIIKSDTRGSQEAIFGLLNKLKPLSNEVKCQISIIAAGIGDISENDIEFAASTNSILVGFNIKAEKNAQLIAKEKNVEVLTFDIIYKMVEHIEELLRSKKEAIISWKKTGQATVLKVFNIKNTVVAGCILNEGVCSRTSKVSCVRSGSVIGEGKISSLQRDRKSVKEVHAGYEFAFICDSFQEWQVGDTVHCFSSFKE